MDDEINYKVLRKIQEMEKNSSVLNELKTGFYKDLGAYLNNLNKRIKSESSTQKQLLLKDEIESIKKIAKNIYEQREKKIVLAAVSKARGGNPDQKNFLENEKKLFDLILETINDSRTKIFNDNYEKDGNRKQNPQKPDKNNEENNVQKQNPNKIVYIKENIPEFIGTDTKKYNLRKNDVITISDDMSKTLLKRDVAEEIKQ
jgi:DNA replication initiation complex subunit (GINS family)